MSVRIKFHPNALYDLRREPEVVAALESHAQDLADDANAAGEGTYAVGSQQGVRNPQGRWRTSVVTADYKAMLDCAKNNTLIRVMP